MTKQRKTGVQAKKDFADKLRQLNMENNATIAGMIIHDSRHRPEKYADRKISLTSLTVGGLRREGEVIMVGRYLVDQDANAFVLVKKPDRREKYAGYLLEDSCEDAFADLAAWLLA